MRIILLCVGKPKEHWVDVGVAEYKKRLSSVLTLEVLWVKDNTRLIEACKERKGVFAFDEKGKVQTSEEFAKFLRAEIERFGAQLTFVIGGAEGLPNEIREKVPLLSLSPMTFPHQIARLLVTEQLYRATTLWQGTPYHK